MTDPVPVVTVDEVMPGAVPSSGPVVAVLVALNSPGLTEPVADLLLLLTRTALQTLVDVGARPWLIDLTGGHLPTPDELTGADGVMLLGGGDVDATLYGFSGPVPHQYGVDRGVDEYSIDAVRASLAADVPTLAICRGSQVLNVALGGTLIPDIEDFALHHGASDEDLLLDEVITVDPQSWLGGVLGRQRISVRSGHHQAIDRVGQGLRVVACADDGIVEGVEHEDHWAVGVQWHPEDAHGSEEDRHRVFGAFVRELEARRAGGGPA